MQHKFVLKEIPLSEIVTGKTNVRVHNVEKDINELAEHISVNGLLEPIIVFQNKSGKYEILAGQRRFTAIKSLGWDKIWCNLRDAPQDEADAKAISLGENLTQLPMTLEDSIEACTYLFERYGDMKIVAKKHGISESLVKKYVTFNRLPDFLKDACKKMELGSDPKRAMNYALKAVDSLGWEPGGEVSDEKVLKFAKLLSQKGKVSTSEVKDLEDEAKQDPTRTIDEIVKAATQQKRKHEYVIKLDEKHDEQLKTYSSTTNQEPEEAATALVIDGLSNKVSEQ